MSRSCLDKVFMISSTFYSRFSSDIIVFAFVAGIAVTLAAVSWPSARAARIEPHRRSGSDRVEDDRDL